MRTTHSQYVSLSDLRSQRLGPSRIKVPREGLLVSRRFQVQRGPPNRGALGIGHDVVPTRAGLEGGRWKVGHVNPVLLVRREENEFLRAGDDGVDVLVVVLVEGGHGALVAAPEVRRLRLAPQRLGRPGRPIPREVAQQAGKLALQAVVLQLNVGHLLATSGTRKRRDEVGEGRGNVGGLTKEIGAVAAPSRDRVSPPVGREGHADLAVAQRGTNVGVGPLPDRGPVGAGAPKDDGPVLRDVVPIKAEGIDAIGGRGRLLRDAIPDVEIPRLPTREETMAAGEEEKSQSNGLSAGCIACSLSHLLGGSAEALLAVLLLHDPLLPDKTCNFSGGNGKSRH